MREGTKPEAEQGTEVREFRVRYQFACDDPGEVWCGNPGNKEYADFIYRSLSSSSAYRNVSKETRTVTTTTWAPVPEEKP